MEKLTAVICTSEFMLTGQVRLDKARLIDSLNNRNESQLTLLEPAMKPLQGSQPEFAEATTAIVPKREIVLAIPMESEEVVQRRSQQRFYSYQTKVACRVFISAPPYRVLGSMNLNPGTTAKDALIGFAEGFLAITAVDSIILPNMSLPLPPVVIVNRDRVAFVSMVAT